MDTSTASDCLIVDHETTLVDLVDTTVQEQKPENTEECAAADSQPVDDSNHTEPVDGSDGPDASIDAKPGNLFVKVSSPDISKMCRDDPAGLKAALRGLFRQWEVLSPPTCLVVPPISPNTVDVFVLLKSSEDKAKALQSDSFTAAGRTFVIKDARCLSNVKNTAKTVDETLDELFPLRNIKPLDERIYKVEMVKNVVTQEANHDELLKGSRVNRQKFLESLKKTVKRPFLFRRPHFTGKNGTLDVRIYLERSAENGEIVAGIRSTHDDGSYSFIPLEKIVGTSDIAEPILELTKMFVKFMNDNNDVKPYDYSSKSGLVCWLEFSVVAVRERAPVDKTAAEKDAPDDETAAEKDTPLDENTAEKDVPVDETAAEKDAPVDETAAEKDAPDDEAAAVEDAVEEKDAAIEPHDKTDEELEKRRFNAEFIMTVALPYCAKTSELRPVDELFNGTKLKEAAAVMKECQVLKEEDLSDAEAINNTLRLGSLAETAPDIYDFDFEQADAQLATVKGYLERFKSSLADTEGSRFVELTLGIEVTWDHVSDCPVEWDRRSRLFYHLTGPLTLEQAIKPGVSLKLDYRQRPAHSVSSLPKVLAALHRMLLLPKARLATNSRSPTVIRHLMENCEYLTCSQEVPGFDILHPLQGESKKRVCMMYGSLPVLERIKSDNLKNFVDSLIVWCGSGEPTKYIPTKLLEYLLPRGLHRMTVVLEKVNVAPLSKLEPLRGRVGAIAKSQFPRMLLIEAMVVECSLKQHYVTVILNFARNIGMCPVRRGLVRPPRVKKLAPVIKPSPVIKPLPGFGEPAKRKRPRVRTRTRRSLGLNRQPAAASRAPLKPRPPVRSSAAPRKPSEPSQGNRALPRETGRREVGGRQGRGASRQREGDRRAPATSRADRRDGRTRSPSVRTSQGRSRGASRSGPSGSDLQSEAADRNARRRQRRQYKPSRFEPSPPRPPTSAGEEVLTTIKEIVQTQSHLTKLVSSLAGSALPQGLPDLLNIGSAGAFQQLGDAVTRSSRGAERGSASARDVWDRLGNRPGVPDPPSRRDAYRDNARGSQSRDRPRSRSPWQGRSNARPANELPSSLDRSRQRGAPARLDDQPRQRGAPARLDDRPHHHAAPPRSDSRREPAAYDSPWASRSESKPADNIPSLLAQAVYEASTRLQQGGAFPSGSDERAASSSSNWRREEASATTTVGPQRRNYNPRADWHEGTWLLPETAGEAGPGSRRGWRNRNRDRRSMKSLLDDDIEAPPRKRAALDAKQENRGRWKDEMDAGEGRAGGGAYARQNVGVAGGFYRRDAPARRRDVSDQAAYQRDFDEEDSYRRDAPDRRRGAYGGDAYDPDDSFDDDDQDTYGPSQFDPPPASMATNPANCGPAVSYPQTRQPLQTGTPAGYQNVGQPAPAFGYQPGVQPGVNAFAGNQFGQLYPGFPYTQFK